MVCHVSFDLCDVGLLFVSCVGWMFRLSDECAVYGYRCVVVVIRVAARVICVALFAICIMC